jgi:hypothetical protein
MLYKPEEFLHINEDNLLDKLLHRNIELEKYNKCLLSDLNLLLSYCIKVKINNEIVNKYSEKINNLVNDYYLCNHNHNNEKYYVFIETLGYIITTKIVLFELIYNTEINVDDIGSNDINFYNSTLFNTLLNKEYYYGFILQLIKNSIKNYKIKLFNLKDIKTKINLLNLIETKILNNEK